MVKTFISIGIGIALSPLRDSNLAKFLINVSRD
jgi:hypothetical protein